MPTALITGISGQDGAYLSRFLLNKNYKIIGLTREIKPFFRLKYLGIEDDISIKKCNLLNLKQVTNIVDRYCPDEIYNLAAQSSVSQSFNNPSETITFNINSVVNILESIKQIEKSIKFYQASSSEMYGNVESLPINEKTPMHPLSPYAISKVAAHWITINYRESFDLFTCCGILFNHESYLRGENYFLKKVIRESLEIKNKKRKYLKVGNIDIRRDFGYSPKYVEAMWLMLQNNFPEDYIVCSGKSVLLRDIVYYILDKLNIDRKRVVIDRSLFRPRDISDIYGNAQKAKDILNWNYSIDFYEVLDMLIEEEEKNFVINSQIRV